MLGKTGVGKSTTANKLVGVYDSDNERNSYVLENIKSTFSRSNETEVKFIESPKYSLSSTTKNCQIITNKTLGISVLDVKGFADSEVCSEAGVFLGNLEIIRNMIHATIDHRLDQSLTFNRVVYFLPNRRIPEKADGNIQEELKVMFHYFGEEIFNRMVIVVTTSYLEDQSLVLSEDMIEHTKQVFLTAYKLATETRLAKCPPIVYISIKDDGKRVRDLIESAEVTDRSKLPLNVLDDTCINCAAKIKNIQTRKDNIRLVIDPTDGERIKYEDSLCHPLFKPKYTTIRKIISGVTIVITLGLIKLAVDLPFFFNSEEICIKCQKPPREPGCHGVNKLYEHESIKIQVHHKNKTEMRILED